MPVELTKKLSNVKFYEGQGQNEKKHTNMWVSLIYKHVYGECGCDGQSCYLYC